MMIEGIRMASKAGVTSTENSPSLNGIWAECVIRALLTHGVRDVVLCPGGRASALSLAMERDPRVNVALVSTDERSGAFAALGMAKARGTPVAVVTTSGSAVANLLPALVEADASAIALVVVSCDRPRHLRGMGFGQMADHLGATAVATRAQADLDDPLDTPAAIERARLQLDAALRQLKGSGVPAPHVDGHPPARRATRGPVHLNVPFAGVYDALETLPVSAATIAAARALWDDADDLRGATRTAGPAWGDADAQRITTRIAALRARRFLMGGVEPISGVNGLIVVGAEPGAPRDAILAFAARTGYPVLADVCSGLRAHSAANTSRERAGALLMNPFDALGSRIADAHPELIIRFGLAPVQPMLQGFLRTHAEVPAVKIGARADARDYLHPVLDTRDMLFDVDAAKLRALGDLLCAHAGAADHKWRERWANSAARGISARRACVAALPWGEVSAAHRALKADGFAFIHIGNSMSVRHADIGYEVCTTPQDVYVNRGVSGIDGTLSTFIGEALARREPGLLLVGDQTLLHDLAALAAAQRVDTPACVCVLNNGGGAIFDYLPLAAEPEYGRAIRNPHHFDSAALAQAFGLGYRYAGSRETLDDALAAARSRCGVTLVEIDVLPLSGIAQMTALAKTMGGR